MNVYFNVCVADVESDANLERLERAIQEALQNKFPYMGVHVELMEGEL